MPKFHTAQGFLTPYALSCGYVETRGDAESGVRLERDMSGAYRVAGTGRWIRHEGERFFAKLTDARRYFLAFDHHTLSCLIRGLHELGEHMNEDQRTLQQQHSPYWHDVNPWRDKIVYVTLEDLAGCLKHLGAPIRLFDGTTVIQTVEWLVSEWRRNGDKLDAYVLPQPSGQHSGGIRYGAKPAEYLSPYCDCDKLFALLKATTKPRDHYPNLDIKYPDPKARPARFGTSTHWRARAEECKVLAKQMRDPESKSAMLQVAKGYERLAHHAEANPFEE